MFRKTLLALYCMTIIILGSGAAPALAKGSPVPVEKVFTPPSSSAQLQSFHEFQKSLYLAVSDEVNGGQIWRSKDGRTWEPATGLGFGINPSYTYSWGMTVFKEKLYVSANCYPMQSPQCPGMILRTSNGKDWEKVTLATNSSLLDKLGVYNGMIYATSVWSGGQIWRSRSGNPGTWEAVKDFGLGDGFGSSAPTEYKGKVYFTVDAHGDSVYIWSSADGLHWNTTPLKITDQDPNSGYFGEGTIGVYQGNLYLLVSNSIEGGTIYRSKDGTHWEKVVNQNPTIIGYRDMMEYNDDLYVTTFNFVDGSDFGVQLWRSHKGDPGSWKLVKLDPANWGAYSGSARGTMAVLKGSLYIANNGSGVFRINTH